VSADPVATASSGNALRLPPTFTGGELRASRSVASVWPGSTTALTTLGGSYPSPTIRVPVGGELVVRLRNDLNEPTNLHWHGLAAPPQMDGYPADVVPPGVVREYTFPVTQRAGTYWYHPHPDGLTARQVYTGMAGFLLVEDEAQSRALGLPTASLDVPLLIQDRRTTPDRSLAYAPTPMDVISGYLGDVVLVNGTPDAELRVAAGMYRLRLLNGSNARVYRLAFSDGLRFHVIATDGGFLDRPVEAAAVDLGPGERVEILVDFAAYPVGASVLLVSLPFGTPGGMMGMGGAARQGAQLSVLRFDVDRPAEASFRLPTSLVPLERLDPRQAVRVRTFAMQMGMGPMMAGFTINGRRFDARRVDEQVRLNELEVWEVSNVSQEIHPFHVHATSFQVLSRTTRSDLGPQDLGWKDTIVVWPAEMVRLLVRFDRYRGLYVLHCHNLEHEDAGMMSAFEVV
jgi:FtsP/CotA-like multicopper oxidase with cupredoxin domain